MACAVENNVPPAAATATPRTGLTWLRVVRVDNGRPFPDTRSVFVPIMCQHCGADASCVAVCPQQAVDVDPATGVVSQIPERCLGCRYCMAACPYHARVFNWTDPEWPAGSERALNPDVGVRMRGTVEKCNLCHGRRHAAHERAAAEGRHEASPSEWTPACVEACPAEAIVFGDLDDAVGSASAVGPSFVLLTTKLVEKITGRRLVGSDAMPLLARISGWLLLAYVLAKSLDTLVWINRTAPRVGWAPYLFYAQQPFGTWILLAEIVALGFVPALLLIRAARSRSMRQAVAGASLAAAGIVLNRYVLTIQTLALPTLSFDPLLLYTPSWQEVAAFLAVVAFGVILYSLSYRYLPLFPQEAELARDPVIGPTLADGGRLGTDLSDVAPAADWQALRGQVLLNP